MLEKKKIKLKKKKNLPLGCTVTDVALQLWVKHTHPASLHVAWLQSPL